MRYSWSFYLPAPVARRLASKLSQCGTVRKQSGKLSLRTQGSHKENLPASTFTAETATLQRQPGDNQQGDGEGDEQSGEQERRRTEGTECFIPARQDHSKLNVSQDHSSRCSQLFFFFACHLLLAACHTPSFLFPLLGHLPPHILFSFFLSTKIPRPHCSPYPLLLPPTASPPSSLLSDLGWVCVCVCARVCRLKHLWLSAVKIRGKFCSAGWGAGCVSLLQGLAQDIPPFIDMGSFILIFS